MIVTAALRGNTLLTNVRYRWTVAGVTGTEQTAGITQPDTRFTLYRISAAAPSGAEEIVVYDVADSTNWNTVPVL